MAGWLELTGSSIDEIKESSSDLPERDFDDVSEAEYCSGYNDIDDVYQAGFHCPPVNDSPEKLYCCGSEVDKYCCETNVNSLFHGIDPAAVVGALLALIVVLLIFVSLCCCCCSCCLWNGRKKKDRRGGHVRYNNLDGTVNTTVSTPRAASPPPVDVTHHRPQCHHDHQPSAPPEILSPSSPPFNPHMPQSSGAQPLHQPHAMSQSGMPQPVPPIQTMPPAHPMPHAHPMPMPQLYPPPMGGASGAFGPPSDMSKEGYRFDMQQPMPMQAPPPYHSPHHQIGFGVDPGPPMDQMPYQTKL